MNDQIKFSCLSCGQHIECDVTESGRPMLCPNCGANLTVPYVMSETPTPPVLDPRDVPAQAPLTGTQTSGLAIASLICSLASPIICIGWLPGIICGHMARSRIRRDSRLTGRGLAIAGLIISYATVLFAVGLATFIVSWGTVKFKQAFQTAQVFILTNSAASSPTPEHVETATNETVQASSSTGPGPGWTMDVTHATIPDDTASGEIHGTDFQLKRVLFRNGNLRLISSDGQDSVLIRSLGDSIANRTLELQTASGNDPPKIEIDWKEGEEKKSQTFQNGYALELKFDNARGRRIPGHIYLCLPDDSKSYLAGTFTIVLPKPRPKAAQ